MRDSCPAMLRLQRQYLEKYFIYVRALTMKNRDGRKTRTISPPNLQLQLRNKVVFNERKQSRTQMVFTYLTECVFNVKVRLGFKDH